VSNYGKLEGCREHNRKYDEISRNAVKTNYWLFDFLNTATTRIMEGMIYSNKNEKTGKIFELKSAKSVELSKTIVENATITTLMMKCKNCI
jgi:hypothetical protein